MPTPADTGNLAAPLPAAAPAPVRAAVRGTAGEPETRSQPADFAAFLFAVGGIGLERPAVPIAPGSGPPPLADGAPVLEIPNPWAPPVPLNLPVPGGRFSPPTGSDLPPGLPTAPSRAHVGGSAAAAAPAALIELLNVSSPGGLPPAPSVPSSNLFANAASAGAMSAPWMRALLAGDGGTRSVDSVLTQSSDVIATGDSLLATSGTRGATPTTTIALPTSPAHQPAFEQALGERLAWLVQEGRHDARIKLHPAELGSVDIRLSLDGDSTRISLASPHAAVRDALELAVPRLREMLGSAGLDLSHVNVGTGDARSHGDFGRDAQPSTHAHARFDAVDDAEATAMTLAIRLPQGLVDTFA
jgi:flagellar hook-length control protein FliK